MPSSPSPTLTTNEKSLVPVSSPIPHPRFASGALGEIERVIAERRIDLVPMFKDFDRRNENMVRALAILGCPHTHSPPPPPDPHTHPLCMTPPFLHSPPPPKNTRTQRL
jgi:hypothetical protein